MTAANAARADATWVVRLWMVIAVSTAVRLLVAVTTGLGVDESYAVTVARPLSWSYFDHPPLHFWMAGLVTWLTGDTQAVMVRLPFVLAFSVTLWAVGRLGLRNPPTRDSGARPAFNRAQLHGNCAQSND